MKIFAISLVKNEEDIIEYNLLEGLKWADRIIVLDNGSNDRTWEIVNKLSDQNENIIAWKQDKRPFRDEMRSEVFNAHKHLASKGDWWCYRFDADEFYINDPREFLAQVPKKYHVVKKESIDFRLTYEDLEEFEFKENEVFDPGKIEYYEPYSYTENRFFRHRDKLEWPLTSRKPKHIGIVYPHKLKLKHYQYRSPIQVQMRLELRRKLFEDGFKSFGHASQLDWREKLFHRKDLVKDLGDGNWKIKGIRYDVKPNPILNLIRRIAHGTGYFP